MIEDDRNEEIPDFDRVHIVLRQGPAAAWAWLAACVIAGAALAVGGVGGLCFAASAFWCVGWGFARLTRPGARLSLGPSQLVVEAWVGRLLPLPRRLSLPLRDLEVSWVDGGPLYVDLVLRTGGRALLVPRVSCTIEELERLVALVEARRHLALERDGLGEKEVPTDLDELRRG